MLQVNSGITSLQYDTIQNNAINSTIIQKKKKTLLADNWYGIYIMHAYLTSQQGF